MPDISALLEKPATRRDLFAVALMCVFIVCAWETAGLQWINNEGIKRYGRGTHDRKELIAQNAAVLANAKAEAAHFGYPYIEPTAPEK